MNFSHLEYVKVIAESGSFNQAAQKLLVSQPYLSTTVKSLEAELGYPLFERSRGGVRLSAEGEEFIKCADKILSEYEKIKKIGRKQEMESESLRVAAYHAPYIMERFLQFQEKMAAESIQKKRQVPAASEGNQNNTVQAESRAVPDYHKEDYRVPPDRMMEMGNREVFQSVASGESRLGIIFCLDAEKSACIRLAKKYGFSYHELLPPVPLRVIMGKNHVAAAAKSLSLEQILTVPYVSYDDDSSRRFLQLLHLEAIRRFWRCRTEALL